MVVQLLPAPSFTAAARDLPTPFRYQHNMGVRCYVCRLSLTMPWYSWPPLLCAKQQTGYFEDPGFGSNEVDRSLATPHPAPKKENEKIA